MFQHFYAFIEVTFPDPTRSCLVRDLIYVNPKAFALNVAVA